MNNFEKEAQKRSVTRMLGRAINPMEWVRQMSSSKYRRMITAVDSVDKIMRDNIIRLKPDLRERLHQARMAFKNRDLRRVFQYTSEILDTINGVFIDQIDELDAVSREILAEFSQDTMDEHDRQQLEQQLGIYRTPRTAAANPELVIEAGITQWIQEKIPTRKEIEGTLFDTIFRNMQGKQVESARQALAIAERAYESVDQIFDTLDANRRNIAEYVRLAKDYQRRIGVEKERMKRMYFLYFPPEAAQPVQQPEQPQQPEAQTQQGQKPAETLAPASTPAAVLTGTPKAAGSKDKIRGLTKDCIFFDDDSNWPLEK